MDYSIIILSKILNGYLIFHNRFVRSTAMLYVSMLLFSSIWRCLMTSSLRRVWRYKRSNQNPYIDEEQTTQWPNEKVQKDKQRSTIHTHKTKDRVTRTPLKTEGKLRW